MLEYILYYYYSFNVIITVLCAFFSVPFEPALQCFKCNQLQKEQQQLLQKKLKKNGVAVKKRCVYIYNDIGFRCKFQSIRGELFVVLIKIRVLDE